MEKNNTRHSADAAKQTAAQKRAEAIAQTRANQFLWIARIFCGLCFFFSGTAALLSLVLLHLTGEAETNSFIVTSPTFSENLAYFEPLHADAPKMDTLAEMFVRQYISARHSVVKNVREMNVYWGGGGIVDNMSSPSVFEKFYTSEAEPVLDTQQPPPKTIEVDMKRIIKDGWNNWQVFFDTRALATAEGDAPPEVTSWIATIQFRYYAYRALMVRRLKNPMGFTVMQYNVAKQKK